MVTNVCKICKKGFFARTKSYCCDSCTLENERIFNLIEDYLMKFPNSNAMQVASGLEIPIEIVVAFIDEGRLSFSKGTFERIK